MGIPSDVFASKMSFLPIKIRNLLAGLLARISNGSNEIYGLQKPKHKFGQTHPTINSELLYKIRHGKIKPRVEIDRFDGKYVFFKDNTNEKFELSACTGYLLSHPFFMISLTIKKVVFLFI